MPNERLHAAIAAFDAANSEDPHLQDVHGRALPHELVQAERLSQWIERLEPDPSEALLLAGRCQHLMRWRIPRSEFPPGRVGYLRWRTQLARFHADEAEKILRQVGYDDETITSVRRILLKQGLRSHHDTQTMEDALCLSFLEHELAEFAAKHEQAKVVDILRKTWGKMSPRAQEAALSLQLSAEVKQLISTALEG
jgi:hypothetical protein